MSLKTTISDEDMARLLERAKRHDPAALDRLYQLYVDRIYRYVWYRVQDADLAEDFSADIFVQVMQSLPTFRISTTDTVAAFSGWLYRVAHNHLHHFYRRGVREKTVSLPMEEIEKQSAEEADLSELAKDREQVVRLHYAIAELPEDQQEVLIYRFWEELSHAEVASLMGRSEGAIKALQHRALVTLRRILAPNESEAPA